jgi:hypothetical protein
LIMGNVNIKNELSSRPERSEVEGPAVSLDQHPIQPERNEHIHRQLLAQPHPMRALSFPLSHPT